MKPKISIIVPVYNAETYIGRSLDSLLSQSYDNLEIIIVDDASSDGSIDVILRYAQADSRIVVIAKKHNEGVSLARNTALERATGDYILFVDGDDWIEPDTCAVAVEAAEQNNADVVMWSYIREMGSESREKHIFDGDVIFDAVAVRDRLYRRMVGPFDEETAQPENADALCTVWGKLYRRSLIVDHEIQFHDIRDIGTYEDGLFNLDVFRYAKKAVFLNRHLYHYRRNNNTSLTTAYNPNLTNQWTHLFDILATHIREHNLDDTFSVALNNRIVFSLVALGINATEHREGIRRTMGELRQIICAEGYRKAIRRFDMQYLPVHWKVFFLCARLKFTAGVYLLLMIIQKIRGR